MDLFESLREKATQLHDTLVQLGVNPRKPEELVQAAVDHLDLTLEWVDPNDPTLKGARALHDEQLGLLCCARLPEVADRALLIPCAHDEAPLKLAVYDRMFAAARALMFNTEEERTLVDGRFGLGDRRSWVAGLHVDEPPADTDPQRFRDAFGIDGPYVLCLGRIDPAKGSDLAFDLWARTRATLGDLTLVMMGTAHMPVPDISAADLSLD